jgi:hypothetical protein
MPDPQEFKDKYAAKVVKGFGNDFGSMKSSRLGDALRGAQEKIVKERINNGSISIPPGFSSSNNTGSGDSNPGKVTAPPASDAPTASVVAEAPQPITPEPIEFNPSTALYYGDSIATGLGHGSRQGNPNSDAHWGRGAGATLSLLNSRPDGTFRDQDIVLSTGVLNSGADWDTVRSQVNFLQGRGARSIRLVGVPNTERYAGWNDQLQSIADETSTIFLGGYTPGSDGVHFDYSTYPVYR